MIILMTDRQWGNIDFRFGNKKLVVKNRQKIASFLGIKTDNLYEMEQVHGSRAVVIDKKPKNHVFPKTDALITNLKNVFLMVKTADCFPVLLFDPEKKVAAACHVGWRGAMEKVFLKTLMLMISRFACSVNNVKVFIGPGGRTCCFKHKHFLQEKLPEWQEFIKAKKGYKIVDIPAFLRKELLTVGVREKNMQDLKICTICHKNYFSHFRSLRENESEARFATIIGLR